MTASARRRLSGWLILCGVLASLLYSATRWRRDLVDFEVYRTAAIRAQAADPLYRPEDGHYQFKYLPAFALLVAPVAWGNPEVTKAVWFALNCALLIWFFHSSATWLPDRRRTVTTLIALTAVVTAKLWVKELVEGQTNLWLAALAFGALAAADQKRHSVAGALIGAAVFVKPYAIVFLPWLAVAAGLPSLVAFAATVVLGLALPIVVYGWSGNLALHHEWWRTVTETTTANLTFGENISIAAMWTKWMGAGPTAQLLALVTSGVVAVVLLSLFARRATVARPSFLEVGAMLAAIPLLSPQGWDYVVVLGIPATVLVLDRWRDVATGWRAIALAAILVTGFTIYDLLGRVHYLRAMSLSILTLSALTLLACVVHLRWRGLA
jgi:hypothetical protein